MQYFEDSELSTQTGTLTQENFERRTRFYNVHTFCCIASHLRHRRGLPRSGIKRLSITPNLQIISIQSHYRPPPDHKEGNLTFEQAHT